MASGHARLKKALVLRDALAHELGLDLAVVMRGLPLCQGSCHRF